MKKIVIKIPKEKLRHTPRFLIRSSKKHKDKTKYNRKSYKVDKNE